MTDLTRKISRAILSFSLWGIMTAIWGYVWYKFYTEIIQLPYFRRGNWVVIAIYATLLYLITHFYGGYKVGFYRRGDIIFSCAMSMIVTNTITYFQVLLIGRMLPVLSNVTPVIYMSLADSAVIWIWATLADKLYQRLNPPRKILCVYGGNRLARSMITKMATRDDKYIVSEAVNIDEGLFSVLERLERFDSVLICDVKSSHRNRILKYCYANDIRVYMLPKISDVLIRGANEIHLFDSPLLLIRNSGISTEQQVLKRIFDIALCTAALIFFSPLMLIIALAVKAYDRGSILYKQERLTLGGKRFMLYKFRSMIENAEAQGGIQLANEDDSRITPVGEIIRKIRFDELPQLINIIKGDMSIVGPRPERPEIAAEYKKTIPEFDFRLKVKAGLTGYAQVLGKYNTTPYDKLKLDLIYITGYSFQLDIKLILMTIKILFMRHSTEGIANGALTAADNDEGD